MTDGPVLGPAGAGRLVAAETVAAVRGLVIEPGYLRWVVEEISAIGSSPWGFRNGGTPEDERVGAFVAGQLQDIGLADVAVEPVAVDGWRFRGARVTVEGGVPVPAATFGGVTGTAPEGVAGPLVDVGDGRRSVLDQVEVSGAVTLLEWRDAGVPPAALALELARRGAAAVVLSCPAGGPWYQAPGAVGAFDGHWPTPDLPLVTVSAVDAAGLQTAARLGGGGRVHLDVERRDTALGSNVVGLLPGADPRPIVIGAHHDGWFFGAFDNATGVAALLGLARALVTAGYRPDHTFCFTSRTAEEYGLADCAFDWCIGAWRQVTDTHPEWRDEAMFHLCLEASGRPGLRSAIETPPELAAWAGLVGTAAEAEGWTPTGWRLGPPVTGTEQWPFLVAGVPGVAAYAWETTFATTEYHTQLDVPAAVDWDLLAAQTRLYALLALEADRRGETVLDHGARADDALAAAAQATGDVSPLQAAADTRRTMRGRLTFGPVGRGLLAVDARDGTGYPFAQAAHDVAALRAAVAAHDVDDRAGLVAALGSVGHLALATYLSHESFLAYLARLRPEAVSRSWAAASHLTPTPDLWLELASAAGEPGARTYGPWVGDRLREALASAEQLLGERLDATRAALEGASPPFDRPG